MNLVRWYITCSFVGGFETPEKNTNQFGLFLFCQPIYVFQNSVGWVGTSLSSQLGELPKEHWGGDQKKRRNGHA